MEKRVPSLSLEEVVDGDGAGSGAVSRLPDGPGAPLSAMIAAWGAPWAARALLLLEVPLPQGCVFHQLYAAEKLCVWKGIGITEALLS